VPAPIWCGLEATSDPVVGLWKDDLAERLEVEGFGVEAIEAVLAPALGPPVDQAADPRRDRPPRPPPTHRTGHRRHAVDRLHPVSKYNVKPLRCPPRTTLRHRNGPDRTHDYPPRQLGDLRAAFGVRAVLAVAALRARRRPCTSLPVWAGLRRLERDDLLSARSAKTTREVQSHSLAGRTPGGRGLPAGPG